MMKKVLILAAIVWFAVNAAILLFIADGRAEGGIGPDQPIAFSHPIHAGDLALDCTYCHQTVEESRFPGIPDLDLCMGCHMTAVTDRPEIQKLTGYWEEGREVVWTKVYELPWHVHFTHKRHIRAEVECETCHGDVTVQMPVRRVRALQMGWCVSCHRDNGADTDCLTCHK